MKNLFLVLVLALFINACQSENKVSDLPPNTYEVTVKGEGIYNGLRAHINTMTERRKEVAIDTAMFIDEVAIFSGKVESPSMKFLTVNGAKGNVQFILEPGKTEITVYKDSLYASKISGGENNRLHTLYKEEYSAKQKEIRQNAREVAAARRNNDQELYNQLYNKGLQLQKDLSLFAHSFIDEHPDSDFSLILLETMIAGQNQDVEKFKNNLASLDEVSKRSPDNLNRAKKIQAFIAQLEAQANLEIGKIAPEFTAPDPDGNMIALSDIRGKATIIDFWASWCGPCRRENPNVVRVYEKYHDKGLEIISVSLDRPNQKQRWLDAIKKDNLTWHHVGSLKYFNDPVARLYSINAIPATFILDEEGRIVAKKLRGQALEDQIASMLN